MAEAAATSAAADILEVGDTAADFAAAGITAIIAGADGAADFTPAPRSPSAAPITARALWFGRSSGKEVSVTDRHATDGRKTGGTESGS
jgi:hypothetical protein